MCKCRVSQHLDLNLGSVSINKVLATEFITVKVWCKICQHSEISRYVVSTVIECLQQNIRKQIDCRRPSSTNQMNRIDYKIFTLKSTNRNITR